MSRAFAVWLTGLPASGKSTIASVLQRELTDAGLTVERLESDSLRSILTPEPTYQAEERDLFYRALAYFGSRLVAHGVPVILDATAHRRSYRALARTLIPHFLEVEVACPLEVCMARDRKGTYRGGQAGTNATVPGLQVEYEAPEAPEVRLDTTRVDAEAAAAQILEVLRTREYLIAARGLDRSP
ncbi:adenylyl-sulfate kinase [Nitrospira sp.]|nr:adenylyl-sulfate kinase [Nitrospira sp.]